jgi:hypothetical protein
MAGDCRCSRSRPQRRRARRRLDRHEDRLAGRDPPLGAVAQREQLGGSEHLAASRLHDPAAGDECAADRRRQAVHREMRRQHAAGQREGGEAAGGVDQRADHSGVEKARRTAVLVAPRHGELDLAGAEAADLEAGPAVEGRAGVEGDERRLQIGGVGHDGCSFGERPGSIMAAVGARRRRAGDTETSAKLQA